GFLIRQTMTLIGSFSIAALSSFWLGALAGCLALTGEAINCPALFYMSRRYDDTPVPKPARIWAAVSGTVQALTIAACAMICWRIIPLKGRVFSQRLS
ncbi:MAG: hypothetical protein Q8L76_10425, partial [Cypionkella sp.]|nr:hypothetical protein [Cypionkella sp.]